jgi:hypothetical protein
VHIAEARQEELSRRKSHKPNLKLKP